MGNCFLYRHIRLDKDEVFYIGIAKYHPTRMIYTRAFSKNRNSIWKKVVSKTEYDIEIVLDELTWEEACKKEIEFIAFYGRKITNEGTLVNITTGGEGAAGNRHSAETKQLMRQKAIGKVISEHQREIARKNATGNKNTVGYKHNEDFKEKCRRAQTGKKMSEQAKKKIGDFWRGKPRTDEVKRKISIKHKGRIIPESVRNKIRATLLSKNLPVHQFDRAGNFIATYNSVHEAAKSVNRSIQSVQKSMSSAKSGRGHTAGYVFKIAV